jgi:hypothetical protein
MNAITESKTPSQNRLEGFVLTTLFHGFPTYSAAVLMIKLMGAREIVGHPGGAAFFVVFTSLLHGMVTPWLAPKFPKFFKQGYEPVFFDESLSFSEKIARWRVQPMASLQLVTMVMLMSLLAVGVASVR